MKILFNGIKLNRYICYIFLFMQVIEYVAYVSNIFKFIDEIVSMLGILLIFLAIRYNKAIFSKKEMYILSSLSFIVFIGLLSNIIFEYQPLKVASVDVLIVCKFVFGYFFSRILLVSEDLEKIKRPIIKCTKYIIIITFGCLILNMFVNIFPVGGKRFIVHTQQLFFNHPTYLSSFCVMLIALLVGLTNKLSLPYIIMCLVLLYTTNRVKAFGFAVACVFLIIYWLKEKRISKFTIIAVVAIMIAISYQQISYYYLDNDSFARSVLSVSSVKIANDHFPLGSGFATFASYTSGKYYSPVYRKYRIDMVYGLAKDSKYSFISDTFWPMIIGQFGWVGTLFFTSILICFYYLIRKLNNNYYYSSLILLTYLLISSTSESSFAQPYAVLSFYIIGMYVSQSFKNVT